MKKTEKESNITSAVLLVLMCGVVSNALGDAVFISEDRMTGKINPNEDPLQTQEGKWKGFDRDDFVVGGRKCLLIRPAQAAEGNPWIWRTEFFGHEPQADSALAALGFYVAYMEIGRA